MARVTAPVRLRDLMCARSRLRYLAWRVGRRPRPLVVALREGPQLVLRPPPAGDLSVAHEIFVQQCYRAPHRLENSPAHIIVDAGAHCGFSLLYFAIRFPDAQLLAFEPHPAHRQQIEKNLRLNSLAGRVSLIPAAAGCAGGRAFLLDRDERSQVVNQRAAHALSIRTVDFFDVIGARTIDLLKLDWEGGEYDLLMDERFAGLKIRALVMECHARAERPETIPELRTRLQQLGYVLIPETPEGAASSILWAFADSPGAAP